jgi:subtilisin family serine protease
VGFRYTVRRVTLRAARRLTGVLRAQQAGRGGDPDAVWIPSQGMGMIRKNLKAARVPVVAVAAVAVLVASMTSTSNAGAAPSGPNGHPLAPGVKVPAHSLKGKIGAQHATPRAMAHKPGASDTEPGRSAPTGVPASGNYAFLLRLSAASSTAAYNGARPKGTAAARAAAKAQLGAITGAQNTTIAALPSKSRVLYRMHAVMSGLAVVTDVKNFAKLQAISGVTAVYPIAPKSISNSYAVPLQRAPEAWQAYGDLGANSTVAIIDTGVDYTHADFGGVGTVANYDAAKAHFGQPVSPDEFPGPKVIGGWDLVGDDYNPTDPTDPAYNPVPAPDPYPLDCNGHGSHVAGTVAGLGEDANGTTYPGPYDTSTPFSTMLIGPGMAPAAKLYAYRVFGCAGSTNVVSEAIDMAADPNGDGDTSDHVDVINMSLGSDYGSPQDGDSVATNNAAALGITMAISSGNAGDLYDAGGSPGNASRSIAAAASADAYSQVDALRVASPAIGPFAAERSLLYDWTKPDLGAVVPGDATVVQVTQAGNLDGCDPLNPTDAAAVAGHIAFVEWTDNDVNRRCGSVARSDNLASAGAKGFIFADDEESFAAGINGSAVIPGVLVSKSGGDAIRSLLVASTPVTIAGTTANGFAQNLPELDDTLAGFSSRGIGDAGNVKPDVTAVGVSVFSAGSGTGNQGLNDSGTSMASPMVAGTAALVTSLHPDWSVEQVKADIMNTAEQDLWTGPSHTGVKFAPQRVGSGRIDVKAALDNHVLAYNATDTGSVSVSFGPRAVTAPTTLTKTIKVENTGLTAATYQVSYTARTSIPGAVYTVSPSSVTVDPNLSQIVTVTLTIDPTKLTKTIDPTVDRLQGGLPRQYQADSSGLVVLTSADAPDLRVPVYSAPRPASVMTQPASVTMPTGATQSVFLPLSGHNVNQGVGAEAVQSTVAGFELQATSGVLPNCSLTVTSGCVNFSDQRAADLKYVGVTSDAAQVRSIGGNPMADGLTYFAISTQGAWRTPAGIQEFDISIDTNRDGIDDVVLFNTRLTGTDVMVDVLIDRAGNVLDIQAINDSLGDTDTALLGSDTLVMPVATAALGLNPASPRFNYGVAAYSSYQLDALDSVGFTSPLSFDPITPGLAMFGSFDGDASALLFRDSPGSVLKLTRNIAAYAADRGKGLLTVHFHNTAGNKAQVSSLKSASTVSLRVSATKIKVNTKINTLTVVKNTGLVPTGRVNLRHTEGGHGVYATGTLTNGFLSVSFTPHTRGTYRFRAEYLGDANYLPGNSAVITVTVS